MGDNGFGELYHCFESGVTSIAFLLDQISSVCEGNETNSANQVE